MGSAFHTSRRDTATIGYVHGKAYPVSHHKDATNSAAVALIILAAYMIVRFVVYLILAAPTLEDWFYRDYVMTLPRLCGFLAICVFLRSHDCALVVRKRVPRAYVYAVALLLTSFVFRLSIGWEPWAPRMIYLGLLTSLVVGFLDDLY